MKSQRAAYARGAEESLPIIQTVLQKYGPCASRRIVWTFRRLAKSKCSFVKRTINVKTVDTNM
jgi:hypothetical protein